MANHSLAITFPRQIFEERSQAKARLAFSLLFVAYTLALARIGQTQNAYLVSALLMSGVAYAIGLLLLLTPQSRFSTARQYLSICIDITLICATLYLIGEWAAVAYPLYLWVIIGNGMRFGMPYMYFAMAAAFLGFGSMLMFSPFWHSQLVIGTGLLAGSVILPLFYSSLTRRLHRANQDLEQQVAHTSYLAMHDQLTGLANRHNFNERLHHEIQRAKRSNGEFLVIFLDLNGFKIINDTHGHEVGDKLLQQFAARLRSRMRETDLVARLGGDEFGVITACDVQDDPKIVISKRFETMMKPPFQIDDITVTVYASMGIASYPADDITAEGLLRHADHKMYAMKSDPS